MDITVLLSFLCAELSRTRTYWHIKRFENSVHATGANSLRNSLPLSKLTRKRFVKDSLMFSSDEFPATVDNSKSSKGVQEKIEVINIFFLNHTSELFLNEKVK